MQDVQGLSVERRGHDFEANGGDVGMHEYELVFYDDWDKAVKIGPGNSLTDILETWGCWLHKNWIIRKGFFADGYFHPTCVVGRSAPFFYEEEVKL